MKAVMISIQPKWCELIASGQKTIEVRKTKPKIETPFKCYVYCTKKEVMFNVFLEKDREVEYLSGKVIGEFVCDKIEDIFIDYNNRPQAFKELQMSCIMSESELFKYVGDRKTLYAWHISDLKIYDKPKELGEFSTICEKWRKPHITGWFTKVTVECPYCNRKAEVYNTSGTWCCCSGTMSVKKTFKPKNKPLTRPPQSWCYVAVMNVQK